LATENLIEIDNSGAQQILTLGSRDFTGQPTTTEKKRIEEVMLVFEQAAQQGKVTATEELVDAEPEFVLE